jgi:ATP-dependent helicase HrpB
LTLPIDAHLPAIVAAVREGNAVIEAAPGAGKTTQVPPALMDLGSVLILEPRRIAARMAARRVASQLGVKLGAEVGYQVRFEDVSSPSTRIRFVTEGVLTRRMIADPALRGTQIVILDEFHERHLDTDLALALLRRLQQTSRPDLRIVVMSATLDAEPVAEFLGGAARIRSEGRLFPIAITHTPPSALSLDEQVAQAVDKLMPLDGDVLVFLPGAAEIRAAQRACEGFARRGIAVMPLFGDLTPEEQDAAVQPLTGGQRKIILSTNIAESSITIEGVSAVIDSGLARIASDRASTGIAELKVTRISKASAAQRAGRAGRMRPGRVIRLYSQDDFLRRPDFDTPEIQRRELSQMLLDLRAAGVRDLQWFQAPPDAAWRAADGLLERLGATGDIAKAMARMPLHPRLSRLVVEADKRGCGAHGCRMAAKLTGGQNEARVYQQLLRFVQNPGRDNDEALGLAMLAAFPDRLAKRQKDREVALASGGSATLADEHVRGKFLLAVDIEDRKEKSLPLIRYAYPIEPEWLIEMFPDQIVERNGVEWNRTAERVEAVSSLAYDGIVIEETRGAMPDPEAATAMLAAKAREADIGRFVEDREELQQFLHRAQFAYEHGKLAEPFTMDSVRDALAELAYGKRSFKELEAGGLTAFLEAKLRLDAIAPTRLQLPSGRRAKVEYAPGQPPWVSSRLQDFFGMKQSPSIAGVPLVVHLLAPNQRPVQVTSDLAGFWDRHYPQIRKELMRRYPRHQWPEKP